MASIDKRPLKAYVRYDGSGRAVASSLVLRRSKPKVGKWKEIQAYECCEQSLCKEPMIISALTSRNEFYFGMNHNAGTNPKGIIDWGDGTHETFDFTNAYYSIYLSHTYTTGDDNTLRTIKVYFTNPRGLSALYMDDGDVGGYILGISNMAAALIDSTPIELYTYNEPISFLDIADVPVEYADLGGCPISNINVAGNTTLIEFGLYNDSVISEIDFTNCSNAEYIYVDNNANLTTVIIAGCPKLRYLIAPTCSLYQSSVDDILITLDNNGLTNGEVILSGGTNSAPSPASATAIANLIAKGWTVATN